MKKYAVCFSGGKDSTLALDRAVRQGLNVEYLVNIFNKDTERVRFHGFKKEIIQKQAESLGLGLVQAGSSNNNFEEIFLKGLSRIKEKGISGVIFGDIHLKDVKEWFEERVVKAGLEHIEPIWMDPPEGLVKEVVNRGYEITITSVDLATAKSEWLGKVIDENLIKQFMDEGIDPCGENGEYHTFVSNGPLFKKSIKFKLGPVRKNATHHVIDIIVD